MVFDHIVDRYQEATREIGRGFKEADDDWAPMLFIEANDGTTVFPLQFGDESEKDMLCQILIPLLIRARKAWMAVLLLSAWSVLQEKPPGDLPTHYEDLPGPRPSEHPDRTEVLQMLAMSHNRFELWSAKILRDDEHPPGLGPWERVAEDEEAKMTGRFVEALRLGLRE